TIALVLFLFDDRAFELVRRIKSPLQAEARATKPTRVALALLTALILTLGVTRLMETIYGGAPEPLATIGRFASPWEAVNSYGLFAVMTTTRPEIIVEGSDDGENWRPYEFRYKPGNLNRAPRWVQPHQPRLDWQMWFAALGNYQSNPWLVGFALRLL